MIKWLLYRLGVLVDPMAAKMAVIDNQVNRHRKLERAAAMCAAMEVEAAKKAQEILRKANSAARHTQEAARRDGIEEGNKVGYEAGRQIGIATCINDITQHFKNNAILSQYSRYAHTLQRQRSAEEWAAAGSELPDGFYKQASLQMQVHLLKHPNLFYTREHGMCVRYIPKGTNEQVVWVPDQTITKDGHLQGKPLPQYLHGMLGMCINDIQHNYDKEFVLRVRKLLPEIYLNMLLCLDYIEAVRVEESLITQNTQVQAALYTNKEIYRRVMNVRRNVPVDELFPEYCRQYRFIGEHPACFLRNPAQSAHLHNKPVIDLFATLPDWLDTLLIDLGLSVPGYCVEITSYDQLQDVRRSFRSVGDLLYITKEEILNCDNVKDRRLAIIENSLTHGMRLWENYGQFKELTSDTVTQQNSTGIRRTLDITE